MTTYRYSVTLNQDEYMMVLAALDHFVEHGETTTKGAEQSDRRKALAMLVISRLQLSRRQDQP
jgi:hypothetical protein